MDVSGTLHFYSGKKRREFFFTFDDDVAQQLYERDEFDVDDKESRRVYISVGADRFIHRRTLSFSRKQTELKVSLCAKGSKDGLLSLTTLYDWFAARGHPQPAPFAILGTLEQVNHAGELVWELSLTEPTDIVAPPGLRRRRKAQSHERRSFEHRRAIQQRDHTEIGQVAERLALSIAQDDHLAPNFTCLWRDTYLDSERIEVRKMGIIADIDIWNVPNHLAEKFIEVKAQKVLNSDTYPAFYLSLGEWRSFKRAKKEGIPYEIWLFQYRDRQDFDVSPENLTLIIFDEVKEQWLDPDGYVVTPRPTSGDRYTVTL